MKHRMKLNKSSGIYKGSNVTFDPTCMVANSYNWWTFFRRCNGKHIFNNYSYSPTTQRHQRKVRSLLEELGIRIDLVIECPAGLQSRDWKNSCFKLYENRIEEIKEKLNNPRRKKALDVKRREEINRLSKLKVEIALVRDAA
jgi:hypothetical protein